ncbi:unnamed protein product [Cladocopium goreaui]|uniref:C2H2-type domain-containing protein n=1 Tax=Cladocopium goreaui TaxID=2562237 RepID=A0A9P1D5G4_9DINO|nr:unnamed protein product [Cladocopium goreaui]
MGWQCQCGWCSKGGIEDLGAHLRGRHGLDTSHPASHKWVPPPDQRQSVRRCVQCNRYFSSESGFLDHLSEVHDIVIKKKQ